MGSAAVPVWGPGDLREPDAHHRGGRPAHGVPSQYPPGRCDLGGWGEVCRICRDSGAGAYGHMDGITAEHDDGACSHGVEVEWGDRAPEAMVAAGDRDRHRGLCGQYVLDDDGRHYAPALVLRRRGQSHGDVEWWLRSESICGKAHETPVPSTKRGAVLFPVSAQSRQQLSLASTRFRPQSATQLPDLFRLQRSTIHPDIADLSVEVIVGAKPNGDRLIIRKVEV